MATMNNRVQASNRTPAVIAALGMTLLVGLAILAMGLNALSNGNGQATTDVISAENSDPAALQQLQEVVGQYQMREQQYQQELAQAADQLNQSNGQLQQYQSLVIALQNAGVIQIDRNGQVLLGRANGDD